MAASRLHRAGLAAIANPATKLLLSTCMCAILRTYDAEGRNAGGSQTVVPVNRPEDVACRRRVALASQKRAEHRRLVKRPLALRHLAATVGRKRPVEALQEVGAPLGDDIVQGHFELTIADAPPDFARLRQRSATRSARSIWKRWRSAVW